MNKVMLIGNVGKDPDVRYYERDTAVAAFSLATTERGYTLQNGIQVPDRTEWHNIVLYKGLAKVAEKYVRKGDKIFIEGKIRNRSYNDQKGVRHYVTEIVADNMEMLTPKSVANAAENGANGSVAVGNKETASASPVGHSEQLPEDEMPF